MGSTSPVRTVGEPGGDPAGGGDQEVRRRRRPGRTPSAPAAPPRPPRRSGAASRRRRAPGRGRCRGPARPARWGCSSCRRSCGRCRPASPGVKVWRGRVVARDELEQRLVDRAELLGAEVGEVDQPPRLALGLHDRQRPDRGRAGRRCGSRRPARTSAAVGAEQAAEAGQAEPGLAVRAAERVEDQRGGLPQVVVAAAVPAQREAAQPGGGEVLGVALPLRPASASGSSSASRSSATAQNSSR